MGGYRRPLCFRTVCSCLLQNHLVRLWCVYTTPLELTLPKISEKIQSLRPAAVPPSGTASQKIAFTFFILRASIFLLKEKGNFLLGSVLTNRTAGLRGRLACKKFPPSCPLHFLPAR